MFRMATELWGDRLQLIKTMEECGELIQAISKYLIASSDAPNPNKEYDVNDTERQIIVEVIDVEIMLEQVRIIFEDNDFWGKIETEKIVSFQEKIRHSARGWTG